MSPPSAADSDRIDAYVWRISAVVIVALSPADAMAEAVAA